jgi:hypothetical protein
LKAVSLYELSNYRDRQLGLFVDLVGERTPSSELEYPDVILVLHRLDSAAQRIGAQLPGPPP